VDRRSVPACPAAAAAFGPGLRDGAGACPCPGAGGGGGGGDGAACLCGRAQAVHIPSYHRAVGTPTMAGAGGALAVTQAWSGGGIR